MGEFRGIKEKTRKSFNHLASHPFRTVFDWSRRQKKKSLKEVLRRQDQSPIQYLSFNHKAHISTAFVMDYEQNDFDD